MIGTSRKLTIQAGWPYIRGPFKRARLYNIQLFFSSDQGGRIRGFRGSPRPAMKTCPSPHRFHRCPCTNLNASPNPSPKLILNPSPRTNPKLSPNPSPTPWETPPPPTPPRPLGRRRNRPRRCLWTPTIPTAVCREDKVETRQLDGESPLHRIISKSCLILSRRRVCGAFIRLWNLEVEVQCLITVGYIIPIAVIYRGLQYRAASSLPKCSSKALCR